MRNVIPFSRQHWYQLRLVISQSGHQLDGCGRINVDIGTRMQIKVNKPIDFLAANQWTVYIV